MRDTATEMIDRAIEEAQGPLPPRFLVKYLLGPWRERLVRLLERNGDASPEWLEAVETTRILLWSVAPKKTDEDKQSLVRTLGRLLPPIKATLDDCDWRAPARKLFLHALATHHARLIRGDEPPMPRPAKTLIDLTDTVHLDVNDPHYRDYLEALNNAQLESITIEAPFEPAPPANRGPRGTG